MKELSLSKIGFFNPGRLLDTEIEKGFVARQKLYEFLFEKIASHQQGSIPQHLLIIGQRGMGKTTLLMRISVELKKEPFKKQFVSLQYPEEQYNVDKLSKFWLNSLDALADALDREGDRKLSEELDKQIQQLVKNPPAEVYPIFQTWVDRLGRCPVLMVDNLNLILDKISIEDQHRLRSILISKGAPIMLGASATVVQQTVEYGEPFYDAFQIQYLKKLSLNESIEVLNNLAKITGSPLHASFSHNRGRIATFHQLTGGTPRTLSMLFPLVNHGFSNEIQDDLDAILDIITPLYKSRFEELSDQLQVILDAIALNWDPIGLEELRKITQLENSGLSPQLKRLVDVGWIQKTNPKKVKGALYEISERFFNIWYIMRRSSRRQKRELYCLSKFLEVLYGEDLEQIAHHRLELENISIDEIYIDIALANALKVAKLSERLRERSYQKVFQYKGLQRDILLALDVPFPTIKEEVINLNKEYWIHIRENQMPEAREKIERLLRIDSKFAPFCAMMARVLLAEGNITDARAKYLEALKLNPKSSTIWSDYGSFLMLIGEEYDEAQQAFKKAIKLDSENVYAWRNLALLLIHAFNNPKESEIVLLKATELKGDVSIIWAALGDLYQDYLEDFSKSEKSYVRALQLDDKDHGTWFGIGHLYSHHLSKYNQAVDAFEKSIINGGDTASVYLELADLYHYGLNDFKLALKSYKTAIKKDSNYFYAWIGLATLYHYQLNDFKEAEDAYKRITELEPSYTEAWFELGELYQYHFQNYEKAREMYEKALNLEGDDFDFSEVYNSLGGLYQFRLNNYKKAEEAYKKGIEVNSKNAGLWSGLGHLYLYSLDKPKQAEKALKRSIKIDPEDHNDWFQLGNVYHMKLNEYEEAEKSYLKSVELRADFRNSWHALGQLYAIHLEDNDAARHALKKAVILDADYDPPYLLLALIETKLGLYEEASTTLNLAIKLNPEDALAWSGLAVLKYEQRLFREAEESFLKALKIKPEDAETWNMIGVLYLDNLHNFQEAERAFQKAIEINETAESKYNLVSLYRDHLNKNEQAKEIFNSISSSEKLKDVHGLHETLFEYHDQNLGLARKALLNTLDAIMDVFPKSTEIDWWRAGAMVVKYGVGNHFCDTLKEAEASVKLRPYYEAIKALMAKDANEYFTTIAAEVREPAQKIFQFMQNYI